VTEQPLEEQPVDRERELDLFALIPEDRFVTLPVNGEPVRYPIPGSVTVAQMVELMRHEERYVAAFNGEDQPEAYAVTEERIELLTAIIRERTPDAPRIDASIDMALLQVLFQFVAYGRNVTVANGIAEDLTDSATSAAEAADVEARGAPL
jgi:hypothetical protein